jgi:hypothetical protein
MKTLVGEFVFFLSRSNRVACVFSSLHISFFFFISFLFPLYIILIFLRVLFPPFSSSSSLTAYLFLLFPALIIDFLLNFLRIPLVLPCPPYYYYSSACPLPLSEPASGWRDPAEELHCVAILSLCNRLICLAIDRIWSQKELLCNF